jgi:cell division protein ZapE
MTNGQQSHFNYPSQQLAARIALHTLNTDPAQTAVAGKLDHLLDRLMAARSQRRRVPGAVIALLRWMGFCQRDNVKGLYIYGGVGRGKTMLMDMFHESLKALQLDRNGVPAIWRLHFHDFMVLAQDFIHEARQKCAEDPIESAAAELAARGMVVCFDEMEVRDIADAMILARLFSSMLDRGVVVVTTSNRHVDDLYKDGLHRDRFLPFIALLKERCETCQLNDGTDWRSVALAGLPAWHTPSHTNRDQLDAAFGQLAGGAVVSAETIRVAGREIIIEKVAGDIGFASFASLCDVPLGARDYLAIAGRFAGLVLSDVPKFTDANDHVARRFMWLIDALYDRGRFLVASADADIAGLYQGHQWQFEFARTASRLCEMTQRGKLIDNLDCC